MDVDTDAAQKGVVAVPLAFTQLQQTTTPCDQCTIEEEEQIMADGSETVTVNRGMEESEKSLIGSHCVVLQKKLPTLSQFNTLEQV